MAFRIGGANKNYIIKFSLDIFVTDRRTNRQKIIDGEIADRLLLVIVTNRRTDGRKFIEGEIADRLNHTQTNTKCNYIIGFKFSHKPWQPHHKHPRSYY